MFCEIQLVCNLYSPDDEEAAGARGEGGIHDGRAADDGGDDLGAECREVSRCERVHPVSGRGVATAGLQHVGQAEDVEGAAAAELDGLGGGVGQEGEG